jgi:hypothetical protein
MDAREAEPLPVSEAVLKDKVRQLLKGSLLEGFFR